MKTVGNDPIQAIQSSHGYLMDRKDINSEPLDKQLPGLTKREYMAIEFTKATMIGIISGSGKDAHGWTPEEFAEEGLRQADWLIQALNEE